MKTIKLDEIAAELIRGKLQAGEAVQMSWVEERLFERYRTLDPEGRSSYSPELYAKIRELLHGVVELAFDDLDPMPRLIREAEVARKRLTPEALDAMSEEESEAEAAKARGMADILKTHAEELVLHLSIREMERRPLDWTPGE